MNHCWTFISKYLLALSWTFGNSKWEQVILIFCQTMSLLNELFYHYLGLYLSFVFSFSAWCKVCLICKNWNESMATNAWQKSVHHWFWIPVSAVINVWVWGQNAINRCFVRCSFYLLWVMVEFIVIINWPLNFFKFTISDSEK